MKNRPLVAVVVAYAIGLLLAHSFRAPLPALAVILTVILILLLAFKRHRKLLIWPLLAVIGWANFNVRTTIHSANDLRLMLGATEPALVTVRGTLAETPHLKIHERKQQELWSSVAFVRVRELQYANVEQGTNDFQPATGELMVTTPGVLGPDFFAGQPVEISGVIQQPPPPLADGLFDYRAYLATRGIYYELKVPGTNLWTLLDPHASRPPLTDRFLNWSRQTLAMGLPEKDEAVRLLWAMTLGWRTAFTGDITDPFLEAGTFHMFAIDGLRIALLSGMIVTLLRVARLSRAWCGLVAVPLIWFYTVATGGEPSAIRASVMMTVVLGGWALKRPSDLLNSLAGAALVILLLWDPRQILEAGFQLSFFVMLVIALLLPPLNALSERGINWLLGPDPLLAEYLVPEWRRKLLQWARRLAQFCGLSFAAWVGSLPLAAKYFHLFSPVSTLANIFAVPLGTLALMANLGALISGHWLPWCTVLFNNAAWFFMNAMTWVSVKCAALPGAYFYVRAPSVTTIIIYYGVIVAAFSGWFKTARRKIIGITVLALIGAGYLVQWQLSRPQTELTVLPLDGGHAIYVNASESGDDWLINCGNKDAVQFPLKDYLHSQGVNSLPRLLLAVGNARNCGGTPELESLFAVREIWTSGVLFRSSVYREAVEDSSQNGHANEPSHKILTFGETKGCLRVLFPPPDVSFSKADDAPLVMMANLGGAKVLLLSELSRDAQSALLSLTNDLHADIVVAGLPDVGEPLCDDLIAAVRPHVIVIADSELPVTRRSSRSLHERLEHSEVPVIYTRTAGAVRIVANKAGWTLRTVEGEEFDHGNPSGNDASGKLNPP